MDIGPGELLIILIIVVVLFGPGRLANIGGELGKAIHDFREGLQNPQIPDEQKKTDKEVSASASHDA